MDEQTPIPETNGTPAETIPPSGETVQPPLETPPAEVLPFPNDFPEPRPPRMTKGGYLWPIQWASDDQKKRFKQMTKLGYPATEICAALGMPRLAAHHVRMFRIRLSLINRARKLRIEVAKREMARRAQLPDEKRLEIDAEQPLIVFVDKRVGEIVRRKKEGKRLAGLTQQEYQRIFDQEIGPERYRMVVRQLVEEALRGKQWAHKEIHNRKLGKVTSAHKLKITGEVSTNGHVYGNLSNEQLAELVAEINRRAAGGDQRRAPSSGGFQSVIENVPGEREDRLAPGAEEVR